jgi:hypothetical protein
MFGVSSRSLCCSLAIRQSKDIKTLRRTDETPPGVSNVDVAMAISGGSQNDAAKALRRLSDQYPEVGTNCPHLEFKGWGRVQGSGFRGSGSV